MSYSPYRFREGRPDRELAEVPGEPQHLTHRRVTKPAGFPVSAGPALVPCVVCPVQCWDPAPGVVP